MRRYIAQRAPVYKRTIEWIQNYEPDNLIVSKFNPPVLRRKPDNILVKNWDRESGIKAADQLSRKTLSC